MNIYSSEFTCKDRTPYTYYMCWSYLGIHYYGRRTAKWCHPNELWVTYFSSSKKVKEFIELFGDPDIIEVRCIFDSVDKCKQCEVRVLKYNNAARSERWLNQTNGDLNWDTTGKVYVEDKLGNSFHTEIDDPRYLSGELVTKTKGKKQKSKNKGTTTVYDKDGKCIRISVDDPRFISGELKGIKHGFVNVKDKDGNIFQVSKNNERYLSGELVHHSKGIKNKTGIVVVRDKDGKCFGIQNTDPRYLSGELQAATKGVPSKLKGRKTGPTPLITCPHCGKIGGLKIMKRWHFDKCKSIDHNG